MGDHANLGLESPFVAVRLVPEVRDLDCYFGTALSKNSPAYAEFVYLAPLSSFANVELPRLQEFYYSGLQVPTKA